MTLQQLLARCSVEDIVRTTMTVYDIDEAKYQKVYANYANYAKLIETLLKLETIPTDDILLGIAYEDEGELHMDTSVYKADQLADGIPYSAILEEPVNPATLSEETLDAAIRTEGWPEHYAYLFQPWAEIMGYQVSEANLEDVGAVPLLVETLYELTFFGFEEADMEAERHVLDESLAEMEAVRALPPEEQEKHPYGKTIDIDELWEELGLPPQSPEEKAREHLEMRHELFRNKQRTYRALRRCSGCAKGHEFEIQGCVSTGPNVSHDEFLDAFIEFVESKGWYFGGGTKDVTDDEWETDDAIEGLLDEADRSAESTDVRYTSEEVFHRVRDRIDRFKG